MIYIDRFMIQYPGSPIKLILKCFYGFLLNKPKEMTGRSRYDGRRKQQK